jgi:hypothetical protein
MLHDPKDMCITHLTPQAKSLVVDQLSSQDFTTSHKAEIDRIIKFIENGQGSTGVDFLVKMKKADIYRDQSFLDTHHEIARAMGYE